MNRKTGRIFKFSGALLSGFVVLCITAIAGADSARELDTKVDKALDLFSEVKGAGGVISSAKGLLVFPSVVKAGFGLGGEYGEGALRVGGKTEAYYNTVSGSFGFQIGIQKKTVILAFMEDEALERFRRSSGWEIGVDGSVAVIAIGAQGSIDTTTTNQPILAFVFDQKGLMYNLTLEGSKITKIAK